MTPEHSRYVVFQMAEVAVAKARRIEIKALMRVSLTVWHAAAPIMKANGKSRLIEVNISWNY